MSIKQSKYGRALVIAAEEAYGNEMVDTAMDVLSIGPGKEWEDRASWIEDRIELWLEEAK